MKKKYVYVCPKCGHEIITYLPVQASCGCGKRMKLASDEAQT